jgi:hypothetical protein
VTETLGSRDHIKIETSAAEIQPHIPDHTAKEAQILG